MNFNFKLYPGLKLLLICILGVFIGYLIDVNYLILSFFIAISLVFLFLKKYRKASYYFSAVCLGFWFSMQINNLAFKSPEKIYQEFPALIQGKIVKILKVNNKQARIIVDGDFDAKIFPIRKHERILLAIYGLKYKQLTLNSGMKLFAEVNARNPRQPLLSTDFPENNYAASLDVKWIANTSARNVAIIHPPAGYEYFIEKQVQSIQNRIEELFSESTSPIVTALLTGDKTKISYETKQLFSLSGTAHILAVSGLHVGIIATIVFFLLGFVHNNWMKFSIFSILIIAFVIISGMQPSAIRAGLMAILFVYAKTLQRHANAINIIAIAVLLILITYPEMLFSSGFQMSVSAILGIVLMFQPIHRFFKMFIKLDNPIINFIITSISISFAASLIVSPLVAYYFKVYSNVSPLANLLVIPLMTLSMCFSILALFFSYIYFPLGSIYASSADFLINLSQSINKWAIGLPSAYISGDSLILSALFISIIIIYVTLSKTIKNSLYRMSFSAISICILILFSSGQDIEKLKIVPREQYVAIDLPVHKYSKTIILFDRKPAQKPKYDIGMLNHLNKFKEPIKLYYCGNAGLSIVDKINKNKNISHYEMDLTFQKKIQKLLQIKNPLPQIIYFEPNNVNK